METMVCLEHNYAARSCVRCSGIIDGFFLLHDFHYDYFTLTMKVKYSTFTMKNKVNKNKNKIN